MRIIALISIPVLMLLDYYLTIIGKKNRDNVYSSHFTSEQYELNPAWQKDINKLKLFNYKHLLVVILVTGYFYFAIQLLRDSWFYLIYGAVFTIYIYIIMQHVQNILTFRYANKHPEQFSGKVVFGYEFSIKLTQFKTFTTAVFLLLLYAWTQSWFLLGGSGALVLLGLIQQRWVSAYRRKLRMKVTEPAKS